MIRLFYYDDETENLLSPEYAGRTNNEEVETELFELDDDDESFVGLIDRNVQYR